MPKLLKRLVQLAVGDYSLYRVLCFEPPARETRVALPAGRHFLPVGAKAIEASPDPLIREQLWYLGSESEAYAICDGERILGLCFFWHGERYRKRNFWPLKAGEAKLVQIVTVADCRGTGVATALISAASTAMLSKGFERLFARVWHSNTPSLRAFERAGWWRVALVIKVHPLGLRRPLGLKLPTGRAWRGRGRGPL